MKDAYSFDRNLDAAKRSYDAMAKAYRAIFDRFGLTYRAVAADSGAIGGDLSEEFQVIAATGEDAIVYSTGSDYAANMEKAEALAPAGPCGAAKTAMVKTPTPGKSTCEDVAALLGVPLSTTVKSLVLATDQTNDKAAFGSGPEAPRPGHQGHAFRLTETQGGSQPGGTEGCIAAHGGG